MLQKLQILILTSLLLIGQSVEASLVPSDELQERFALDEIIIQYQVHEQPSLINKQRKFKTTASLDTETKAIKTIAKRFHLPLSKEIGAEARAKFASTSVEHNLSGSNFKTIHYRNSSGKKLNVTTLKLSKKIPKRKLRKIIDRMNAHPFNTRSLEFEAAYPNYIFEIVETATPNDSLYDNQWGLQQIGISNTWKHSQGEGIVVAVIDTGVDFKHKDLTDSIWTNSGEIPNNKKDDDKNGFVDDVRGWDFVRKASRLCQGAEDCRKRDKNPMDINGHGTHVAGIIAAQNNNKIGISGIAPQAKIMPLKAAYSVGSQALLKSADVMAAMEYAINNKADVINMSFAGSKLGILRDLVTKAHNKGIVLVAAAGNAGSSSQTYPAALPEVISVGSVGAGNIMSTFSNRGNWVDILAPGNNIISTVPDNNYSLKSGTSMSAPFVSGMAAIIKAQSQEARKDPDLVKERILSASSKSLSTQSNNSNQLAITLSGNIDFPLEVTALNVPELAFADEEISFSGTGADSDSEIVAYEWESDQEGFLSAEPSFSTYLTEGTHSISLKVRNRRGYWSEAASRKIQVVAEESQIASNKQEIKITRKGNKLLAKARKNKIKQLYWTSDIDGDLGSTRSLDTSELSPGLHKIRLAAENQAGDFVREQRFIEI